MNFFKKKDKPYDLDFILSRGLEESEEIKTLINSLKDDVKALGDELRYAQEPEPVCVSTSVSMTEELEEDI